MNFKDLDIFILYNIRKQCLTTKYVGDVPHTSYNNTDWDLPKRINYSAKANRLKDVKNQILGAYRCYRGHQEMLKLAQDDYILIFEDDAVPNKDNWRDLVVNSVELLNQYEVVSLHTRPPKTGMRIKKRFAHKGHQYIELNSSRDGIKWGLGSLAYLIKKENASRIYDRKFDGMPVDLILHNEFKACSLHPSCFDHDRRHGSLIEVKK